MRVTGVLSLQMVLFYILAVAGYDARVRFVVSRIGTWNVPNHTTGSNGCQVHLHHCGNSFRSTLMTSHYHMGLWLVPETQWREKQQRRMIFDNE